MQDQSITFPRFSDLPPELRRQVWLAALPEKDDPAMYFYRSKCWETRKLSPSDKGYEASDPYNLVMEFIHGRLGRTPVNIPIFSVNREASDLAESWAHDHGHEIYLDSEGKRQYVIRAFDSAVDTLLVEEEKSTQFFGDGYDRLFEDDMFNKNVSTGDNYITRIAISEKMFRDMYSDLHEMFQWFLRVNVWYIVVDMPDDLRMEGNSAVQPRWEIGDVSRGRAYVWDNESGGFVWTEGEYIGDEDLYICIEEMKKDELVEHLRWFFLPAFEIRPVLAVRK